MSGPAKSRDWKSLVHSRSVILKNLNLEVEIKNLDRILFLGNSIWSCQDLNLGPLPYQDSALTWLSYRTM